MPPSKEPLPLRPLARLPAEWTSFVAANGGRAFHGPVVFRWIQSRGVLAPSAMTDIPGAVKAAIEAEGIGGEVSIADERRAFDSTRKILVRLEDGATVETVLIPGVTGNRKPDGIARWNEIEDADAAAAVDDDEEDDGDPKAGVEEPIRVSQCISTQVGCAMGCVFCASGVAGLKRHLRADEIVGQVLLGRSRLDPGERLRNVVFMGMGEPLHNYEEVVRALRLITHPDGIALSSRRVTVSTSGLVPEIKRLGEDFGGRIGLAISLHAADDETRTRLMPINKKYPLATLMDALRAYPLPPRRRITIEYTLVAGKNDTAEEAKRLVKLLRGLPVKVNLIPMNPIEASTLGPPSDHGTFAFQRVLTDAGYSCFIRKRRGDDVAAACGQLALLGAKPKVRVDRT